MAGTGTVKGTETTGDGARLRSILGGAAGNLVEWYDWYAYSAFALYFAPVFFPADDPTSQLLNTAAIFAVGFVMRPLGAWIMGIYADRRGRKAGLTLSVTLMCLGSLVIALCPGYERIGVAAPVLLVLARMVQGLSVGGEYGASATYLSEMAGKRHRGFFSSFQYVTLIAGQLIALAVLVALQALISEAALESWGWRIPFAIGAALALVVFRIRRGLVETAEFDNVAPAARRSSGWALFTRHPREAATVVALTAGGTLAFYAYTTYMQKFLINSAGFDRATGTRIMAAATFVFMLLQPVAGALSDRVGRRPLLIAFGIFGALLTVPIFSAIAAARTPVAAFLLIGGALMIVTGYTSINAVVKAELFPAHIRALGVALPYAIANTLFGGTAEYLALWFKSRGIEAVFFWYVAGMIAISLIVAVCMRDTARHSRIAAD